MYNKLNHIPNFENWKIIKKIEKGWSSDSKFYIEDFEGNKLLLRISDVANYDDKYKEFQFIKKCNKLSFAMSQAMSFGFCNNKNNVYMLLTWVEGESLEYVLKNLSEKEQYKLGLQAGRILKSIHLLKVNPEETVSVKNKKIKY